ncbi:hypothetical protein V6N13_090778 [Hibiscus sabdariffa]|uniref:Uncharacterized protein n=1 Tax=Hibiscus sabdariffa TaxID=183260 RepID=A0ABR2BPM3_9ROSI
MVVAADEAADVVCNEWSHSIAGNEESPPNLELKACSRWAFGILKQQLVREKPTLLLRVLGSTSLDADHLAKASRGDVIDETIYDSAPPFIMDLISAFSLCSIRKKIQSSKWND